MSPVDVGPPLKTNKNYKYGPFYVSYKEKVQGKHATLQILFLSPSPHLPTYLLYFFFQPQQRNVPFYIFQTVLQKACVRLGVICPNKYQHRLFISTQLFQAILHTYYQLAFKASRNEEEFMLDTGKEEMQKY